MANTDIFCRQCRRVGRSVTRCPCDAEVEAGNFIQKKDYNGRFSLLAYSNEMKICRLQSYFGQRSSIIARYTERDLT